MSTIIGKVYGRLKVIGISSGGKVICECECGNLKEAYKWNLINNRTKSCGCLSKELQQKKYKDIAGQTFGLLKPIKYAGHKHGRVAWTCQCECGNECIVTAHDLLTGHTKSCGCLKKKGYNARNIKGQIFRELQAIEPTNRRSKKGSIYWNCKCLRCGNTTLVTEDTLVHGNQQTCGCIKNQNIEKMRDNLHFYEGTCLEYLKRKKRVDNKTGITGVSKAGEHAYIAKITFQGKAFYLGRYESLELATRVRKRAEAELHDKFISCYENWLSNKKSTDEEFEFRVRRVEGGFFQVD